MKPATVLFQLAAGMSFFSCNSSTDPGNRASPDVLIETAGYSVSLDGKKMIERQIAPYCTGSVLSSPLVTDSGPYSISGNTLTLETPDTLGNGGIVWKSVIFSRSGQGSGLQGGVWEEMAKAYPVISSGSLDSNDQVELARDSLLESYTVHQLIFTGDSLYGYGNIQEAQAFMARWGFAPSTLCDSISVSPISQYVAKLKGLRTGEIVTLTYSSDDNEITYSGSLAPDSAFHYYRYPQNCPDPEGPAWFQLFLETNLKQSVTSRISTQKFTGARPSESIFL